MTRESRKIEKTVLEKLGKARNQYAQEWGTGNASKFSTDGYYKWMAEFIGECHCVLEVGTGNGSSTIALLSTIPAVVSLDENPDCLKMAEENITNAGYAVTYEKREHIQLGPAGYNITYGPPKSSVPDSGALLLEADILKDPVLLKWLKSSTRFDGIVCWFIGTYYERAFNSAVQELAISNPVDYRIKVHSQLCQIADQLLSSGGILHYVDRGEPSQTDSVKPEHQRYYSALAQNTSLNIESISYAKYKEPDLDEGASIRLTPTAPGKDPDLADKALVSAVYRKA